jgi:hypothetical protein
MVGAAVWSPVGRIVEPGPKPPRSERDRQRRNGARKRGLAAFLWSVERNKRGRDEIQLVEPEN